MLPRPPKVGDVLRHIPTKTKWKVTKCVADVVVGRCIFGGAEYWGEYEHVLTINNDSIWSLEDPFVTFVKEVLNEQ